jgi:hypothetical protein
MMQVESVLTEVRTRLLEFMLELSDAVGADIADRELFQKASTIDTAKIFHTTIFNPGTVILGSENFQVVNQKDDIDGLIEVVGQLGFAQGQLEELRKAVLEDQSQGKIPNVGDGETNKWFTKALQEAGRGTVKVGVDIVSTTIVNALKSFAGL